QSDNNAPLDEAGNPVVKPVREPQVWNADRVGVLEKLWGEGHALPGGDAYLTALSSPLGINSDMSVLDLGAGLGDLARLLVDEYKTYVTGMEADGTLAARGMVMSIASGKSKTASIVPYDSVNFTASRKFDCIFAREIFYKTIGKDKFFKAIDASIKTGGGQIVFTDYILDPVAREKPAIVQWLKRENGAAPLSSIEMIKQWKGMGYDLRVAEDQTDAYRAMILTGLKNLVDFMIMNRPDIPTKLIVVREVDLWVRRVEAFGQGLKYYRFFGIRH
ncbi:MAG: class I SAM-dependent methyltransferase, partial [Alphaproteobacteria bacterium]|nr:class I SAM-dependent methyltransferase [Alphaproteobacteria bacterium]